MKTTTPNITLSQSTPGSWTHIDILVDGIKLFHAAKFGTDFWVIADLNGANVGSGGGRTGVKAAVKAHLLKEGEQK